MEHEAFQARPRRSEPESTNRSAGAVNSRAFTYYARLRRLRDHLEEHISEPLSSREAARIAGVSPTYFSSFFHDRVGVRFTVWIRSVRVACACEILRTSNASITEVARLVGFNDLRTFQRAFRMVVGTSAREYKKRLRPAGSHE